MKRTQIRKRIGIGQSPYKKVSVAGKRIGIVATGNAAKSEVRRYSRKGNPVMMKEGKCTHHQPKNMRLGSEMLTQRQKM